MIRRFFSTTLGQILAIVALSSFIGFLTLSALLMTFYPGEPPVPPWPWPIAYRIAGIVHSLREVPPAIRTSIIVARQSDGLTVSAAPATITCHLITNRSQELQFVLQSELRNDASGVTVRACDGVPANQRIQALVGFDGETLEFRSGTSSIFVLGQLEEYMTIGVAFLAMSGWAVWRVTGPLRRLSEKAEAFGHEIAVVPIVEEGPIEIRRVAQAFNFMQQRVTRSIRNRARMLAAISHDLRTPLTRMRLQLETKPTELIRAKLLREVDQMQSMITSVLTFLSGSSRGEEKEWIDVGSMLSTLCDEFEERGASVTYEGHDQARLFCRPNAMIRALTNLIENGISYGEQVQIEVHVTPAATVIEITDDGPGIPADRVKDVVEPFVRLDPSRSDRPGSVGLGLSIVKEIVESHGGELSLTNRQPNGLVARLSFPNFAAENKNLGQNPG